MLAFILRIEWKLSIPWTWEWECNKYSGMQQPLKSAENPVVETL